MRLVDFLDQSPALFSEKGKFVDLDNDLSLSYRQMVDASIRIAGLLKERGVKRQDIVATVSYTHLTLPTNREV